MVSCRIWRLLYIRGINEMARQDEAQPYICGMKFQKSNIGCIVPRSGSLGGPFYI